MKMSTFTMRLHEVCGVQRVNDVDYKLIGLDTYPIFDPAYRDILNLKIIRRFWNREIAHETAEMFRFRMETKMFEIMPYYNQLIKTTQLEFDPFETVNLENISTMKNMSSGESQEMSKSDSEATSLSGANAMSAEYPQSQLRDHENYATTGQESKSESQSKNVGLGESDSSSRSENESDSSSTSKGSQGNKSVMLLQYRDTLLNIDVDILDELESLFFSLMGNDNSYSTPENYLYPGLW